MVDMKYRKPYVFEFPTLPWEDKVSKLSKIILHTPIRLGCHCNDFKKKPIYLHDKYLKTKMEKNGKLNFIDWPVTWLGFVIAS